MLYCAYMYLWNLCSNLLLVFSVDASCAFLLCLLCHVPVTGAFLPGGHVRACLAFRAVSLSSPCLSPSFPALCPAALCRYIFTNTTIERGETEQ